MTDQPQHDPAKQPAPGAHAPAEAVPHDGDGIQVGTIAAVGALSTVVLALVVLMLTAWFYSLQRELIASRQETPGAVETPLVLAEQQRQIAAYRWVAKADGVVAIPIDEAMRLTVKELAAPPVPVKSEGKP